MAKSLDAYNQMRDFNATPEPSGAGKTSAKSAPHGLQFCIQKHDASHLHYDFRLELDGTLKSWAIPKGPSLDPKARRLAVHVEDHPLDYARFEGHIPEGHYGAGDVIVWDRGVWIPDGNPREDYAKGKLRFTLQGEKLSGAWNLFRTHLKGKKEQWLLVKSNDEQARTADDYDIVEAEPDSVVSDRTLVPRQRGKTPSAPPKAASRRKKSATLSGVKKAGLPATLKPQLATLVESPPDGDWRYELKLDGYRVMARIEGDKVQLFTRNGHDWTAKMPEQAMALAALGVESAWLDGEMVVADDQGLPDFQALQNAFESEQSENIVYHLFDLPFLNGFDLRESPLEERRAALTTLLKNNRNDTLHFSEDFTEPPQALLDNACRIGLEGLIGKRAGSPYVSRRSSDWIKLKCKQRQEFVVVGFTDPKGSREGFGALLLGLHDADSGELRYAGKVGSGFTRHSLLSIHATLKKLETAKPAVSNPPGGGEAKGVHWLKPRQLAEVAFAEMTRDGSVRHAVFHGLRNDKTAEAIVAEKPIKAEKASSKKKATQPSAKTPAADLQGQVRITHPDRVIDPSSGITKRQLAEYYAEVAPWILPHLKQRPVALVRAPEGLSGELFFQKNADSLHIPSMVHFSKAEAGQAAMVIDNAEALLGAVQMGAVELHTWNATAHDFSHPDRFILDLDPDPALPWKSMVEATHLTLTLLDELGLKAFLKTSGGKGLHIVVPLTAKADWDQVKDFSHAIVKHLAGLAPDRLSAVSGPKNRLGKIFIDYLRNSLGATTACPFGVRAREGLPVSVPIYREELTEIKAANRWNIGNLHERLADLSDDPWEGFFKTRQTITARMRKPFGLK